MRKARPLLALTCLLDLLFVMVFVALLLEEPQKLKDLENLTEALQIKISQLEQDKSQLRSEMDKAVSDLNETKSKLGELKQELEEEKSKNRELKKTTIIPKGVWRQDVRIKGRGRWKEVSTGFHFLDAQGKCRRVRLSFDSIRGEIAKAKSELPCDDQLKVWEWDFHGRTSGHGKFYLTRQSDNSYHGWECAT